MNKYKFYSTEQVWRRSDRTPISEELLDGLTVKERIEQLRYDIHRRRPGQDVSFLRDGNHVIRLTEHADGEHCYKWLLIDGPWFDLLYEYSYHYKHYNVRVPYSPPFSYRLEITEPVEITFQEWELTAWHPGSLLALPMEHHMGITWRLWNAYRQSPGWCAKPNGEIPAYFNRKEANPIDIGA